MRGSTNFCRGGGGGGGPGPTARKQPGQRFYLSSQLILQFTEGVQWFYLQRKLYFSKDPEGSNIFQGGGYNFFQREMHITCDFQGGGQDPYPPSGSAHGHVRRDRHLRICNEYRLIHTWVAAHKQLISAQMYCQ